MKVDIENLKYLIEEMDKAEKNHPNAVVYYDWKENEIRITYPLPKDYNLYPPK